MIRRNIELEARLIDDLLDLTRISKGKIELRHDTVDMHAVLRTTLEICASDLEAKAIRVSLSLEADSQALSADATRLQQIFWNLIKNAVKFSQAGGELIIRASNPVAERVRVEIEDTGVGIDSQLLPRIFDAFEQGAGQRASGLGLGLAITRALVELHGGTIGAHSAGKNTGATFCVEFPTVNEAAPVQAPRDGEESKDERCKLRLLVVEDHADTNRSLQQILQRRGYEVRTALSVREACEVGANFDFDLLVSDMGLPDGTGLDVFKKLAEHHSFKAIALSGYGMEEDVQRSKAAGFFDHLTKPVDVEHLDRMIQRASRVEAVELH